MRGNSDLEVRCAACRKWARAKMPFEGLATSFAACMMIGNTITCPRCGAAVLCGKTNVRQRHDRENLRRLAPVKTLVSDWLSID